MHWETIRVFEWDRGNLAHILKHSVTSQDAEDAVLDPMAVTIWTGYRGGEYREWIVGMTRASRLLSVVVTERGVLWRVVSTRDAARHEAEEYTRR